MTLLSIVGRCQSVGQDLEIQSCTGLRKMSKLSILNLLPVTYWRSMTQRPRLPFKVRVTPNTSNGWSANKPEQLCKGGTGKAEAAKLPDAEISLEQCPEK